MKKIILTLSIAVLASPAFATTAPSVPEMDAGAGIAAVALLIGMAAIIRERRKRK